MAAIPRELIESELFGHEKGAFTGAIARGVGKFELAQGGTLFLDEIGDMPMEAQTRLLRVLQTGEFTSVGGRTAQKADVRIIAATHRDLRQLIVQGRFREDLFYRLNVVPIHLPALRERRGDIADLARHFVTRAALDGLASKILSTAAVEELQRYDWPGNVRELENLMRRIAVLYSESVIDARMVSESLAAGATGRDGKAGRHADETLGQSVDRHLRAYFAAHQGRLPAHGLYDRILHEIERPLLTICLEATRGNQIKAAELLGLNRNTLRKKLRELDIRARRPGTAE
jgi:two-component system nitrogen regulation response regulator GlnG